MPQAGGSSRVDAALVAQIGALASAVVASACCWLPLLLIAVGVSGTALSATFEAWRPVLLPVTFVLLGVASYFTYRKPKVLAATSAGTAPSESCCSVPKQGAAEACCPPENAIASVSYEDGRARVTAGPSVSEETLRKTVSAAGYTVTSATRDGQATRSGDQR